MRVKGAGSGRESAVRALSNARLRSSDRGRHPAPAQRLPREASAAASDREQHLRADRPAHPANMARLHRTQDQAVPPGGDEALPSSGRTPPAARSPCSAPRLSARGARPEPPQGHRVRRAPAREAEAQARSSACSSASSSATSRGRAHEGQHRREPADAPVAPHGQRHPRRAASPRPRPGAADGQPRPLPVNGRAVTIPSYRSARDDVIQPVATRRTPRRSSPGFIDVNKGGLPRTGSLVHGDGWRSRSRQPATREDAPVPDPGAAHRRALLEVIRPRDQRAPPDRPASRSPAMRIRWRNLRSTAQQSQPKTRIRWRNFELRVEPTYGNARASIEPFERGFGHTIGNGLRRVLLSSIEGTRGHRRAHRRVRARVRQSSRASTRTSPTSSSTSSASGSSTTATTPITCRIERARARAP